MYGGCVDDVAPILAHWGVTGPFALRVIDIGSNNDTRAVDAPAGAYVLRIQDMPVARVTWEYRLLERLRAAGLPFAVPQPLRARSGETFVAFDGRVASLFPTIPGERPRDGDLAHARAAGEALAVLDRVLARINMPEAGMLPPFVELHALHRLVPNPRELPRVLGLKGEEASELSRAIAETARTVHPLCDRLPLQLIHGDYFLGNALIRAGHVSGVLDFEFAARDVRALDLAVGLYAYASKTVDIGLDLAIADAFGRGYAQRLRLTSEEFAALPALIRLARIASLVFWTGRELEGRRTRLPARQRAADVLRLSSWLDEHGSELATRAASW